MATRAYSGYINRYSDMDKTQYDRVMKNLYDRLFFYRHDLKDHYKEWRVSQEIEWIKRIFKNK